MLFNTVTAFIGLAFLSLVRASPLSRRDLVIPKIITPNAGTVWTVGHVETITWDTSNFPADSQISNPTGRVVLGYEENNSLNLDLDHPLASGFKLREGSVQITVPDVKPRDDYIIVLFGNSGNTSPAFTITKITATSPSPSTSSSTDVAPSQTDLQPHPSPSLSPTLPPASVSPSAAVPSADPQPPTVSSSSATAAGATTASSTLTTEPPSSTTNGATTPAKTSRAWSVSKNMRSLMALTTCMMVTVSLLV